MGEKLGGQRGGLGWAKTETSAPIGHWPSSSTENFNFLQLQYFKTITIFKHDT